MNAAKVVEDLKQRFPNEPEYIQAVSQVLPRAGVHPGRKSGTSHYRGRVQQTPRV